MKKKVNPNRQPMTMAQVNKAKKEATTNALRRMLYLFLFVLIDKHNAPEEDIKQLVDEVNYYADSISKWYINWKDIEHTVKDEYNLCIPW